MVDPIPTAAKGSTQPRLLRRRIPSVLGQQSRGVPAWGISILLHVALFVGLAAIWRSQPAGTSEASGPVGIAVVYQANDSTQYALADSPAASAAASPQAAAASLPATDVGSEMLAEALNGLLPGADAGPTDAASAGGNLGLGDGLGELGSRTSTPKVKTRVFGIEGEGSRFVYVFDRSDSMNGFGGRPLQMAKSELLQSLESLAGVHEFQIIFYNDSPLPFGGASGTLRLHRGDQAAKTSAQSFVRDIPAIGGTQHIDALRMALSLSPDIVFFLTDADFPAPSTRDLENLHDRAARSGTTLHCVQFGSGPNQGSGRWIQFLAEGTRGQFRYVDVSQP